MKKNTSKIILFLFYPARCSGPRGTVVLVTLNNTILITAPELAYIIYWQKGQKASVCGCLGHKDKVSCEGIRSLTWSQLTKVSSLPYLYQDKLRISLTRQFGTN